MALTAVAALVLLAAPAEPFMRLRAVGDVMLGTSVPEGKLPPDDGAHLLDGVASLLSDADLTFANMEGPLCDSGTSAKCRKGGNCFAFRTPTSYAKYLKAAGIDLASTANNHAGDFGEACRRETEAALEGQQIAWSGPKDSVARVTFKGKTIAMLGFHTSASCNDVNDLKAAKKLVESVRGDSDFVIVSFHGGAEGTNATHVKDGKEKYLGENRGDLKAFTHGVIDAGADLVIGHGPHVVRGIELYKERLIAYSLGNFATYGRFDLSGALGYTVMLEVSLSADGRFLGGKLIPTRQEGKGVPMPDESGRGAKLVRTLTMQDFPKTGVRIDENTFELSGPRE